MNDRLHQQRTTQRALAFLLAASVYELYNGSRQLVVDHSFGDGYFCHFTDYQPLSSAELKQISQQMQP